MGIYVGDIKIDNVSQGIDKANDVINAENDIKNALIEKGVEVPDGVGLDGLAELIGTLGMTPATLTVSDIDNTCTVAYMNPSGELITAVKPANGATFEIGVPSIAYAYNGVNAGIPSGEVGSIYRDSNRVCIYAMGDCRIEFLGK